ncbi:hypothetical protein CCACVL1_01004, partial [Corchorus capsularis]
ECTPFPPSNDSASNTTNDDAAQIDEMLIQRQLGQHSIQQDECKAQANDTAHETIDSRVNQLGALNV